MSEQLNGTRMEQRRARAPAWINLVLGAWLFVSPWVLAFGDYGASWNAWIVGAVVFIVALTSFNRDVALWQKWINLVLDVWAFIAPWVLGFYAAASWDHWVVGALLFLVSGAAILSRTGGTYPAMHAHR